MIRRPPRSTRTDTRFPYTTLFRSHRRPRASYRARTHGGGARDTAEAPSHQLMERRYRPMAHSSAGRLWRRIATVLLPLFALSLPSAAAPAQPAVHWSAAVGERGIGAYRVARKRTR